MSLDEELTALWRRLDLSTRERAVAILQEELDQHEKAMVRTVIRRDGLGHWLGLYHFGWGMSVRNLLREKGLKDSWLPPGTAGPEGNWDDYYGHAIEVAVGARYMDGVPT
jgi:hypothetical protein